jgi:hypothetical protein
MDRRLICPLNMQTQSIVKPHRPISPYQSLGSRLPLAYHDYLGHPNLVTMSLWGPVPSIALGVLARIKSVELLYVRQEAFVGVGRGGGRWKALEDKEAAGVEGYLVRKSEIEKAELCGGEGGGSGGDGAKADEK